MVQMGPKVIDRSRFDWDAIDQNDFWCPDPAVAAEWEDFLVCFSRDRTIYFFKFPTIFSFPLPNSRWKIF